MATYKDLIYPVHASDPRLRHHEKIVLSAAEIASVSWHLLLAFSCCVRCTHGPSRVSWDCNVPGTYCCCAQVARAWSCVRYLDHCMYPINAYDYPSDLQLLLSGVAASAILFLASVSGKHEIRGRGRSVKA